MVVGEFDGRVAGKDMIDVQEPVVRRLLDWCIYTSSTSLAHVIFVASTRVAHRLDKAPRFKRHREVCFMSLPNADLLDHILDNSSHTPISLSPAERSYTKSIVGGNMADLGLVLNAVYQGVPVAEAVGQRLEDAKWHVEKVVTRLSDEILQADTLIERAKSAGKLVRLWGCLTEISSKSVVRRSELLQLFGPHGSEIDNYLKKGLLQLSNGGHISSVFTTADGPRWIAAGSPRMHAAIRSVLRGPFQATHQWATAIIREEQLVRREAEVVANCERLKTRAAFAHKVRTDMADGHATWQELYAADPANDSRSLWPSFQEVHDDVARLDKDWKNQEERLQRIKLELEGVRQSKIFHNQ